MFQSIYIEEDLLSHPRVQKICDRYSHVPTISCQRYGEVFNCKAQNFRLQKANPSLILAKKWDNFVLRTPEGYGIGGTENFYFSHMYNCIFDCRYCFLQGMYSSAHYVIFINFEDFARTIEETIKTHPSAYFFSGYDCDSLALEPITHFIETFLPLFNRYPTAHLELRTKSTQVQFLLKTAPLQNCIVAYSLSPDPIAKALEHKAPPLSHRLKALKKLQEAKWPIGLRFDPLIYCNDYKTHYKEFFASVFTTLDPKMLHSVTLGPFRLPKPLFKKMRALYPKEKLFAHSLDEEKKGLVTYRPSIEKEMVAFCSKEVLNYLPKEKFFPCTF